MSLDFDLCLNFYAHDVALHSLIRSTNLIERFFREFRTKADEIGAFPNEIACLTVFHLIVLRDHPTWRAGDAAGAALNLARFSCVLRAVSRAIYRTCQRHT